MVAKQRGITFGEKVSNEAQGYANIIEVAVKGDHSSFTITGTYVEGYGPRIVNIQSFDIDFYPEGYLLYILHTDQPGVIGKVGKVLGDHHVNIATMQVGRKQKGGEAIMMLSFDKPLDDMSESIRLTYKGNSISINLTRFPFISNRISHTKRA
jgi:D-3-phosphoglycerate dehydrogenase / 2-oxoglutarate reductase